MTDLRTDISNTQSRLFPYRPTLPKVVVGKETQSWDAFLQISLGSTNELEYELFLSHDLKFLENETFTNLNKQVNEVKGMLITLNRKLKT